MARVNSERLATRDWGGRASFSGAIVTLRFSKTEVAPLLPRPLALRADSATHPVIVVFGELSFGGAHFGGVDLSLGARYREIGVMIPFVAHPAEQALLLFPYAMLADDVAAVGLGNAVYGLRKRLVRVDWTGPEFQASEQGRLLFESSARLGEPWSRELARVDPGLQRLRAAFALPVLGLRSSGQYVLSRFDWDLGGAEACVLEAEVSFRLGGAALNGRSEAGSGFGVRGLLWRTTAPKSLSGASEHPAR